MRTGRRPTMALAMAALIAAPLPAAASEPAQEPVYSFHTLLVPQDAPAIGETRTSDGGWVRGGLFADRSARLDRAIASAEDGFDLAEGQLLALARSRMLIGCTIDRMKIRSGRPHICLADRDGDGRFDAWFPFFDEIMLFANVRKVPMAKMKPITAAGISPVDIAALATVPTRVGFELAPRNGRLAFCRTVDGKSDGYCTHDGPGLDPSGQPATARARGGEFAYRRIGKSFEVSVISPVPVQRF
ncbi:hypothetical protein K7G82_06265 [Sphingomonas colocasiae]|uniref:Uncharacterized protein n=2 Tax=Sphingomonas colocasiae TaxID=1848973 RepID=A0ABS7PKR5_9SPHN|nr:hypothetical protein [Sphingomonas colocasiae]